MFDSFDSVQVMAEDLEFNPFFKALQGRFFSLYERAQQNCWLICLPTTTSLQTCNISKQFTERHILEPSGLFRDVYKSTGPGNLTWQLNGSELQCMTAGSNGSSSYHVTVIAEELAYNKSLKQFKMFIVDKPLDPSYKEPEGQEVSVGGHSGLKDVLERKRTYQEHRRFLTIFQNYKDGLEELNRQIRLFMQNYLVVERESLLLDTAAKLEGMVRQGNAAFQEANRLDTKLQDRRVLDACWISLEGYLMHHVHSKVYPAIRGVHAKKDRQFSERCRLLRGKLTPSVVGVSRDYECPYPSTLAHLRLLDPLETPLEILYTIQDAMDSIMVDVKANFIRSLRIGEPSLLPSDDLISVLATILVQVDFKCLLSDLYYVEHFHWFSDSDQLSYILVTFRAAVEFLRGPEVGKWLPNGTQQKISSPYFPVGDDSVGRQSVSPSHSLSTSEAEDSCGSGGGGGHVPNLSLALLSQLRLSDRAEEARHYKPRPQTQSPDSGLGPFLSQLLENDHVTSSDYYGK